MKKFTNKNIQHENNFLIRRLVIFILIIFISFIFKYIETQMIEKTNSQITDLNSIIISDDTKVDKKAYVDICTIPYQFAVSDSNINSYYIVSDNNNYLYIAFMSPEDFNNLNREDIKDNPIKIQGMTALTSEEIKVLAIDAYNEGLDESEQLSMDDFNDYFGSVYLDMTLDSSNTAVVPSALFVLFLLFGGAGTILSLYQLIRFKISINNMDITFLQELDNQMNNENAFYYSKAHIYLTDKYIINFNNRFVVIDYNDIIWMYPYEHRVNGIKTSKSIKVVTKDKKTYTIASIEPITKAKKDVFDEIFNTIANKNKEMLLGYTKENMSTVKERFSKKNNI